MKSNALLKRNALSNEPDPALDEEDSTTVYDDDDPSSCAAIDSVPSIPFPFSALFRLPVLLLRPPKKSLKKEHLVHPDHVPLLLVMVCLIRGVK